MIQINFKSKLDTLKSFLKAHAHLPAQGSDEWLEQRLNRIGGSELSAVLKQNKNKSVNKLIMEKLNFDPFKGNVITYWGNVFEELIRLYTEELFNCSVYETGSIPYHEGYLSYSPDGLGVVSSGILKNHLDTSEMGLDKHKEYLTLFEFKCPHSRIPDYNIPEHYKPQITVGMNIIDIMEVGLFIQAVYRRCAFKDIAYNWDHNGSGHFKKPEMNNNPKETGFMVMYCEEEEYADDLIKYLHSDYRNTIVEGIVDLGSIYDSDTYEELMRECVSKRIKIDYSYREKYSDRVFDSDGMTQAFYNASLQYRATTAVRNAIKQHKKTIIGVMPYKLLDIYITPVRKEPSYIQSSGALSKAQKVVNCINDHRLKGSTVKADVMKSVRAYKL